MHLLKVDGSSMNLADTVRRAGGGSIAALKGTNSSRRGCSRGVIMTQVPPRLFTRAHAVEHAYI
jgi:hypothetical protein